MIRLYTERLLLRDHVPEDLETHHALLSDAQAMRYLPEIQTDSKSRSLENLQQSITEIGRERRELYFLRIEDRESHEHIGEIGYTVTEMTPLGKLVGVGYFIHERYWGLGYTSEALQELVRFAFEEDGVCRIMTGCLKENVASERVMQKCGFTKEAEFLQYQYHKGSLKDRVEYRLLRTQWLQNKEKVRMRLLFQGKRDLYISQ